MAWTRRYAPALIEIGAKLEELYRDAVDIEFTVEVGTPLHAAGAPGQAYGGRSGAGRGGPR